MYSDPYETISKEDIEKEFKNAGLTIKSISSDTIGTGTKIETENATYMVLIYGDVDGNGQVNVRDVQCIVKHLLYGNGNTLTGINKIAANVDNETTDVINVRDAQRIVQFIIGKKSIIDSKPTSDLVNDKEAPTIVLNGDKEITVKVFSEYKDNGAEVTDNLDPNVKLAIDTSKVNTEKPGDYTVTYTATDASGNKGTATRTVHVVDYVSDIYISIYPNQHYVVGQTITLDNMQAYEVYAYAGRTSKIIDNSKVKFTPEKATESMIGSSEITLTYMGVKKNIAINVTEQIPVITLTGHRNADNVKLYVGDTYTEGATAYDDTDKQSLGVTYQTYKIIDGTKTAVSQVDTTEPGTYKIEYVSEENSVGKIGTRTRTVEIYDYVTSATVEATSSFNKDYVEGDTLSLNGLVANVTYAYGGTKQETTNLSSDVKTITYDRDNLSNNTDRALLVTYTAEDPITGEKTPYNSTGIKINVSKKFEVLTTGAEIYTPTPIATINENSNAEANKISYSVSPSTGSCKIDGSNIVFTATEPYTRYTVTLKQTNNSSATESFVVTTTVSNIVDSVKITNITTEDGTSLGTNRFEVGDTVYAELSFYHMYGDKEIPITNVQDSRVSAEVYDDANKTIKTSNVNAIIESDSNNVANRVKIVSQDGAVATTSGKDLYIAVRVTNDSIDKPNSSPGQLKMKIYEKSVYNNLTLDVDSNTDITLSLRAMENDKTSEDLYVKEIGDYYYTLIPVKLTNQYNEPKKIIPSNLTANYDEISSKLIAVYDGFTTSSNDSYISVIGVTDSFAKARTTDTVSYIGIAIKDTPSGVTTQYEDALKGKPLKIYFNGASDPFKTYTINVVKQAVANLADTSEALTRSGECYSDVTVAKVTSGARQEALTSLDLDKIGCLIEKCTGKDNSGNDIYGNAIDSTTLSINENTTMGITKTIDSATGIVTIKFWADEATNYRLTPYITIDGKQIKMTSRTATIIENREINEIKFVGNENDEDMDGKELTKGAFGVANIGEETKKTVEFCHKYSKKLTDTVTVGAIRPISVNYKAISVSATDTTKLDTVAMMYDDTVILPNSTYETALIDTIMVLVNSDATDGGTATFRVEVDNDIATDNKDNTNQLGSYGENFTVEIGPEAEIDHLKVGNGSDSETIKLYATEAKAKTAIANGEAVAIEDGKYYTIVPIAYVTSRGRNVATQRSKSLLIDTVLTSGIRYEENNIAFIDNANSNTSSDMVAQLIAGTSQIDVKGFNLNATGKYSSSTGFIKYIGIAALDTEFLSNTVPTSKESMFNETVWGEIRLQTIKVYYKDYGASSNIYHKTFNIENGG